MITTTTTTTVHGGQHDSKYVTFVGPCPYSCSLFYFLIPPFRRGVGGSTMVGRVVDRMPHDSGPRESVIRRQVRIVGNRDVEAHRTRRSTDRRTAGGGLTKVRACGNRSNAKIWRSRHI